MGVAKNKTGGKLPYFEQRAKMEEAQRLGQAAQKPNSLDMSSGVQKLIRALAAKPNFDVFDNEMGTVNPFSAPGKEEESPLVVMQEIDEEACATG